ncbi:MAG: hypothetical protein ACTSU2_05275 [Promethearchaeota archaeon]
MYLTNLRLIIAEYIPFGKNAMIAFNKKLDAFKDVKDSIITAFQDENPEQTQIKLSPINTRVILLTYKIAGYSNFVAELVYPEASNIKQNEYVAFSITQNGRVILGIDVTEIENEKEKFYCDYIPRLLVDMDQDSSKLLFDLLSVHQRELLQLIYESNTENRQKYTIVLADEMYPQKDIDAYIDHERKENELKQILEYIEKHKQFKNGDKIFVGTSGTIIVSKNIKEVEPILVQFAFCRAIDVFINNYFIKMFGINDAIKNVKAMTPQFGKDPNSISKFQDMLTKISAECVLMTELSKYIQNSIKDALLEFNEFKSSFSERQKEYAEFLEIEKRLHSNYSRIDDIQHLIKGLENDMNNLKNQISVIQEKRLQQIFRGIKETGQIQRRMNRINQRQEDKMQILEIILSGSLAFDIIGIIVGEYTFSTGQENPKIFGLEIASPGVWFLINILVWIVLVLGILKFLKYLTKKAEDTMTLYINYDRKINAANLTNWLESNTEIISVESEELDDKVQRTYIVELVLEQNDIIANIVFDEKNSFLNYITLEINQPKSKNKFYYQNLINRVLRKYNILMPQA